MRRISCPHLYLTYPANIGNGHFATKRASAQPLDPAQLSLYTGQPLPSQLNPAQLSTAQINSCPAQPRPCPAQTLRCLTRLSSTQINLCLAQPCPRPAQDPPVPSSAQLSSTQLNSAQLVAPGPTHLGTMVALWTGSAPSVCSATRAWPPSW